TPCTNQPVVWRSSARVAHSTPATALPASAAPSLRRGLAPGSIFLGTLPGLAIASRHRRGGPGGLPAPSACGAAEIGRDSRAARCDDAIPPGVVRGRTRYSLSPRKPDKPDKCGPFIAPPTAAPTHSPLPRGRWRVDSYAGLAHKAESSRWAKLELPNCSTSYLLFLV